MSFPRYPRYKDSGVEWLGEVPEHWLRANLKWLADLYSGGTPDRGNEEYWSDGTIPWLGSGEVNQTIITEPTEFISELGFENSSAKWVPKGSLVMALAGQGKTKGMVAQMGISATCNQSMAAIVPKCQIDARFLFWWLASNYQRIRNLSGGDLRDGLNLDLLGGIVCPIPPSIEQEAIATFLHCESSKIDALIVEQQRLIELLKEKRQAVISHAVTYGLDPDAPMTPSGVEWLGDVPAHWQVMRLAALFREVSEAGTDDLPVLSVSIHDGVSDREFNEDELDRKVSRSEDRSKYKQVAPGDLVYNMMRAWQGGFGTVAVSGMVSPAYVVARPTLPILTRFVEYLLRTPMAVEQMRRNSRGVTDFRLRLYWDEFKNIKIAMPPFDEAVKICELIANMDAEFNSIIESAEQSIILLQERRTALISAAVTGKIDVRSMVEAA